MTEPRRQPDRGPGAWRRADRRSDGGARGVHAGGRRQPGPETTWTVSLAAASRATPLRRPSRRRRMCGSPAAVASTSCRRWRCGCSEAASAVANERRPARRLHRGGAVRSRRPPDCGWRICRARHHRDRRHRGRPPAVTAGRRPTGQQADEPPLPARSTCSSRALRARQGDTRRAHGIPADLRPARRRMPVRRHLCLAAAAREAHPLSAPDPPPPMTMPCRRPPSLDAVRSLIPRRAWPLQRELQLLEWVVRGALTPSQR